MPRRKKKHGSEKPENPGISFEKAVARVQQMIDPRSTVTHNEKIVDRVGVARQFDVVIRGRFAGNSFLGVAECKDHGRRKGPGEVDAFAKKAENLRANLKLMVSRRGFTARALTLAKHEGIVCLSLIPAEPSLTGFTVGETWYGRLYGWRALSMSLHLDLGVEPPENFAIQDVKWRGKPVFEFFVRELLTTYSESTAEGPITLHHNFSKTRDLDVNGTRCSVSGISFVADRFYIKKKKWVSWIGDGFYNWQQATATFAVNTEFHSTGVESDLSAWDDYDGVIPEPGTGSEPGILRLVFTGFPKWDTTRKVVDLAKL